jgi:signal peptidase II
MNLNRESLLSIFIIAFFLLLDLQSKKWAKRELRNPKEIFNGKIILTYVRNYGIAFNKFSGRKRFIIRVNLVLFIYLFYLLFTDSENYFYYSLILAGGLGNFISRIKDGYVTDFIYFNIKKWPVFNIADFEIFIGVGILFIRELV